MADIRIAHFSDIHLAMAPDRSTINLNRLFSWGNWVLRRSRRHSLDRLDKTLKTILQTRPNCVICTGDMSHTGLPYELAAASDKLNTLTDSGIPVLLTGGNHDHYNKAASREIADLQQKHGLGLKIDRDGVCQLDGLVILLLHQGIFNPFYMARGRLNTDSLRSVQQRLQSGHLPAIHLAAGHFPVYNEQGQPISIRKRLGGDVQLKQFLIHEKIPAYLCGHCHSPFSIRLDDGCVQYCAGSITHAGVLRLLHFSEGQLIETKTLDIEVN
jgi:DNA repair exonuclease SbcCD nuclease subunit